LHIYPFLQLPSEKEIKKQYDDSLNLINTKYRPLERNLTNEKKEIERKLDSLKEKKETTPSGFFDRFFDRLLYAIVADMVSGVTGSN